MVIYNLFDQVADLISHLPTNSILDLKPNQELTNRFEKLVQKAKNKNISIDEKDELDHFIVLERLIRLAKIRASQVAA
jgi:hypothetical protein